MIPSVQTIRELNGISTEVLIQTFADRILILITQLGKVGNLVCYHLEVYQCGSVNESRPYRFKQRFRQQRLFCHLHL